MPVERVRYGRVRRDAPEAVRVEPVGRRVREGVRVHRVWRIGELRPRLRHDRARLVARELRRLARRDAEAVAAHVVHGRHRGLTLWMHGRRGARGHGRERDHGRRGSHRPEQRDACQAERTEDPHTASHRFTKRSRTNHASGKLSGIAVWLAHVAAAADDGHRMRPFRRLRPCRRKRRAGGRQRRARAEPPRVDRDRRGRPLQVDRRAGQPARLRHRPLQRGPRVPASAAPRAAPDARRLLRAARRGRPVLRVRAEIGYRWYAGVDGPQGFFLGGSALAGSFTYVHAAQPGVPLDASDNTTFAQLGGAIDAGYQLVFLGNFAVGAGAGVSYTVDTRSPHFEVGNHAWDDFVYGAGLRPRLLLSIGAAW